MYRWQRVKVSSRFLTVFSVFICAFLLFSFFRCDLHGSTDASSVDTENISPIVQASQSKQFNSRNVLLAIHMPQPMDCMVSSDIDLLDLHLSFEFWKLFFTIPSGVSLAGLSVMFLCLGAVPGLFFVRKFTRFVVIPHSIHAPPCGVPK